MVNRCSTLTRVLQLTFSSCSRTAAYGCNASTVFCLLHFMGKYEDIYLQADKLTAD